MVKVLIIGDIYGNTGRQMVDKHLSDLRRDLNPDWVIANGENVSGGTGLSPKHRDRLLKAGVDGITTGNHIFARSDWPEMIAGSERVLRPHNIGGDDHPGRGWTVLREDGKPVLGIMNLAGRVFMEPAHCPFKWARILRSRMEPNIPVILDFHAEATSEKIAMSWYLDGEVSFVAGTHTHVQTADERILPKGTGAISDIGMTGSRDGILGVDRDIVLQRFVLGYSERFFCAKGPGLLEGIFVEIDDSNRTTSVRRIRST